MSKKYAMKNWKGFASRYVSAMTNFQAALVICDNEEVKTELRDIYEKIENLAERLDRDN